MKKHVVALGALLVLCAVPAFAAASAGTTPTITGGTGIITSPSAYTISDKHLDLGFWWVNPETLAFSAGFGIIEQLEVAVGLELDDNFGGASVAPLLHGRAKYRFYGSNNGQNAWAFGLNFDMALGDDADSAPGLNPDKIALAPYFANTFVVGDFEFNWGIGYTFGMKSHINFFVGISKMIFNDIVFIDADFSNVNYRFNFSSTNIGIGNIAVRVSLMDKRLNISAGLYNAFEEDRQFGAGISFRL